MLRIVAECFGVFVECFFVFRSVSLCCGLNWSVAECFIVFLSVP